MFEIHVLEYRRGFKLMVPAVAVADLEALTVRGRSLAAAAGVHSFYVAENGRIIHPEKLRRMIGISGS